MMNFMECYCEICNGLTEPEWLCDTCERHYCEDCSYTYTLYYNFQGSKCYQCADQSRRHPLTPDIRKNSINIILNMIIKDKIKRIKERNELSHNLYINT